MLCSSRRGLTEEDFELVAEFFDRAVVIAQDITAQVGPKMKDFKAVLQDGPERFPELVKLGNDVKSFAQTFPTIGY